MIILICVLSIFLLSSCDKTPQEFDSVPYSGSIQNQSELYFELSRTDDVITGIGIYDSLDLPFDISGTLSNRNGLSLIFHGDLAGQCRDSFSGKIFSDSIVGDLYRCSRNETISVSLLTQFPEFRKSFDKIISTYSLKSILTDTLIDEYPNQYLHLFPHRESWSGIAYSKIGNSSEGRLINIPESLNQLFSSMNIVIDQSRTITFSQNEISFMKLQFDQSGTFFGSDTILLINRDSVDSQLANSLLSFTELISQENDSLSIEFKNSYSTYCEIIYNESQRNKLTVWNVNRALNSITITSLSDSGISTRFNFEKVVQ